MKLGHPFRNPALLTEALTHRSAVPRGHRGPTPIRSNERLEFIGDRVLGLVMAEWLAERYPKEAEGLLARRHADLVAEASLVTAATAIGLGSDLIIGPNEARAGVGQGAAVLADGLEAVLGAVYLDGGLDAARTVVRDIWGSAVAGQSAAPKHPKSDLKEWLEARGHALPQFIEQSRDGPPHALTFTVTVAAMGQLGTGMASTKQTAEREAAADLLARLDPRVAP